MKTLYNGTEVSLDTPTRLVSGKRYLLTQDEIDVRTIEAQAVADAKPSRDAQAEINRLEATITTRRRNEAILTADGKAWLSDVSDLIDAERAKL